MIANLTEINQMALRKRVIATWPDLGLPGTATINVSATVTDAYGMQTRSVDVGVSGGKATIICYPIHGEWYVEVSARIVSGGNGWYAELPVQVEPENGLFDEDDATVFVNTAASDWIVSGPA